MCRGGGSEVCGFAKPCKCLLRAKIRTTAIKLPISAHIFHVAKTALHKGCRMHPIRGGKSTYIGRITDLYRDCCRESCTLFRVQRHRTPSSPIYLFKVLKQALRLIASIPLIQRKEKHLSREGKCTFPQWYSSIYARSLKDQVRKSKYPRT